jgi:hypothetical protein
MFKDLGGEKIDIQGIVVNLPPVGYVFNKFTQKLEHRGVYARSEIKREQYWEIPKKPHNVKRRLDEEYLKRKKDPDFFDRDLQAYRDREWDRTTNGFWFYLKKKPIFLTGQHYFFLCHWSIKGDAPNFRTTDVEWHYFWEYCWEDPKCYGMLEITQRQQGKSVRAGCTMWYRISRAKEAKGGIQSKADKDAERLFSFQIVNPMKRLERIFKPTMDSSLGSTPKNKISFNKTSTRTSDETKIDDTKELVSEIDYRASAEAAYDGETLLLKVDDECGKVIHASAYSRHYIVKPALFRNGKIAGKVLATTTVEDIGDFDKYDEGNFQKLWDESDHLNKDPKIKETKSGMYRYFLSAEKAYDYNEYGEPKIQENRLVLENWRESFGTDTNSKVSFIRKYPMNIEEAFWTPSDEGIYDQVAIEKAKSNLMSIAKEELIVRGNLIWKGNQRLSGVDFIECKDGRFAFNKKFNVLAECKMENVGKDMYGELIPKNKLKRILGVDPFDHNTVKKGYTGSNAAAYLYFKYEPRNPLSETFVAQYLMRPTDIAEFHEDIAKLAFLTGAEILVENQKQLLINHLASSGFEKFIVSFDGNTPGVPASPKNKQAAADATTIYIRDSIDKVVFIELLLDWNKFNLKNSTKFDAAMAAGWALLGSFVEKTEATLLQPKQKGVVYDMNKFY